MNTHHRLVYRPLTWCHVLALFLSFVSALTNINSTTNPQSPRAIRQSSPPRQIPITVLSGFLGSGKTSLLQHILQNGKRIAVIVNDVASVNIDSKLVKGSSSSTPFGLTPGSSSNNSPILELQNGCACCSLSEELLASVSELILLSDMRQEEDQFDHIVIELSGVADPKSVRAKFQEALLYCMPLMQRVRLDTLVTVIDCSVFLERLRSKQVATPTETPELFYRDGQVPQPTEGADRDESWDDMPPALLEALGMAPSNNNYGNGNDPNNNNNGVADLLVGQTETADVLLLNKVDLLDDSANDDDKDDTLNRIRQICRALNPRATILQSRFGQVPMSQILAVAGGEGVVEAGIVDDHRDAVEAAIAVVERSNANDKTKHESEAHDHSHAEHEIEETGVTSVAHNHAHISHSQEDCTDPTCTDSSHSHTHHDHASTCDEPGCTDLSHSHSHEHTAAACTDPGCTDPSHVHSHEHTAAACNDPDCTDPSHTHNHNHDHAGIGSFVYRARRPFHPGRLVTFLRRLPVVRGLPDQVMQEDHAITVSPVAEKAIGELLRSKGFTWCADSDVAAFYWSHAGSSFELQCLGRWWATLPREQWPSDAVPVILADFDDKEHEEDPATTTVGDRRQEIVFIGQELGRREWQHEICKSLDQCLVTDEEWSVYQQLKRDEAALRLRFANPVKSRILTY